MTPSVSPTMLAAGSRVVVVVSSGPPPITPGAYVGMPDLLGKVQGKALAQLQDAGLSAQVFNDYSDIYKRGEVLGQLPPGATGVPVGGETVLLVSSGSSGTEARGQLLPDVVGASEAEAVSTLERAGFSPQIVRQPSQSVPAGRVSAQLPSRASLAAAPAKSTPSWVWAAIVAALVVAGLLAAFLLGGGAKVDVPDVLGLSQAEAIQVIEDAGLVARVTQAEQSSGEATDTVVSQNPPAGTEVDRGSSVEIMVPTPLALTPVPDVVGEDQATATKILRAAGFSAVVTRKESLTVERGLVVQQTPRAGEGAAPGTQVAMVISSGPAQQNVTVPNVVGLTRPDAQASLQDLGLKVVIARNADATVAEDVVASQLPAAGDSVAPGTSVGIVVSTGPPATPDQIATPDVTGVTLAEAQQVLSDVGLDASPVATANSGRPANEVVAQIPEAGTQVQSGSSVVLFYSTGP